jgi:peptidoglycan hydrolase-like protein with peptidoglycan-binding domain
MTATTSSLRIGSQGAEVIDLQHLLLLRGGVSKDIMGPVDGHLGPKTAEAIRHFKTSHGLQHYQLDDPQEIDTPWDELTAAHEWPSQFFGRFLQQGLSGAEELQQGLQRLGFYRGAIDGIFGPITHAAVVQLQKTGTPVKNIEGVVGPLTYAAATRNPDYSIELQQNTKCSFITGNNVNLRTGPGLQFPVVTQLNRGDVVRALYREGDWVQLTARVYGNIPNEQYEPLMNNPWVNNQYINGCSEDQFEMWRS